MIIYNTTAKENFKCSIEVLVWWKEHHRNGNSSNVFLWPFLSITRLDHEWRADIKNYMFQISSVNGQLLKWLTVAHMSIQIGGKIPNQELKPVRWVKPTQSNLVSLYAHSIQFSWNILMKLWTLPPQKTPNMFSWQMLTFLLFLRYARLISFQISF